MKTKITLEVQGLQIVGDGKYALLTKPSKTNPSPNGVHIVNQAQIDRISERCLGVKNVIGLKHMIQVSNGSAKLTIDAEDCKAGETFTKANGETGTYTKDWVKYNNHEISLGIVAQMKLAELSLADSFKATQVYAKPVAVAQEEEQAPTT